MSKDKELKATKEIKEVEELFEFDLNEPSILQNVKGLDLDNFAYRWVSKSDESGIWRKQSQGWEICRRTGGGDVEHFRAHTQNTKDGAKLGADTIEIRELILMQLPRAKAEARTRALQKKNAQQLQGVEQKALTDGGGLISGPGITVDRNFN